MQQDEGLPVGRLTTALGVFAALLMVVVFAPESLLSLVDRPLQSLLLSVRSEPLDLTMVAVTLLGDFHFTTVLMLVIAALLWIARRYWLAVHALAVFVSVKLTVAIIKTLVVRARPLELYPGGDIFSFPSGHAASAAVLFGVSGVLMLARKRGGMKVLSRQRSIIIALLTIAALIVALSRVYLRAHWPSDVVASLALAMLFITAFAWQVKQSWPLPRWLGKAVAGSLLAGYAGYALLCLSREFDRYRDVGSFLPD